MKWIVLALLLAAVLTLWRAGQREAAAERAFPATGAFVSVGGARVHYVMRGSGPDLVLIHGASGSLRDFDMGLIDALAAEFRVVAFDRPGHGWSDPLPDAGLAAQVRVLRQAAAELGVTRPVLVGQSYGGAVSLAWALEERPAALVLISAASMPWPGKLDPWYRMNETAAGRAVLVPLATAWVADSFIEASMRAVFAPEAMPQGYGQRLGAALSLRRGSLDANLAQVNALRPQLVPMVARYRELTMPVELLHGDADTIVPLEVHSRPLSRLLPDARLTVLQGAGHMPHHTRQAEVIAAIRRAAGLR